MKYEQFTSTKVLNTIAANPHLTDREKHMIGIAVTATRGCIKCTGSRIKKARESGVPYDSVLAAIDLAAAVNAGVTLAIAIQGTDLVGDPVDCEGGACAIGAPKRIDGK